MELYSLANIKGRHQKKIPSQTNVFRHRKQYFRSHANIGGFVFLMTLNCNLSVTNKVSVNKLNFISGLVML